MKGGDDRIAGWRAVGGRIFDSKAHQDASRCTEVADPTAARRAAGDSPAKALSTTVPTILYRGGPQRASYLLQGLRACLLRKTLSQDPRAASAYVSDLTGRAGDCGHLVCGPGSSGGRELRPWPRPGLGLRLRLSGREAR